MLRKKVFHHVIPKIFYPKKVLNVCQYSSQNRVFPGFEENFLEMFIHFFGGGEKMFENY